MKNFILTLFITLMVGILAACTENTNEVSYEIPENDWELSSTFEHSVVYESGKEGSYTVVGSKDGIGFIGPFPIIAKDKQKYLWFYFGKENIYDKPVEVKAIKKGTEELVDILSGPGTFYEGAKVSPDSVNMPSHLKFPSAGVWKILVYIDEELYESIVIEAV